MISTSFSARVYRVALVSAVIGLVAATVSSCGSSTSSRSRNVILGATVTREFAVTPFEDQSFVVPDGVTAVDITISGAQGGVRTSAESVGSGTAGKGGVVAGHLTVTPGETLMVQVGQKGDDESSNAAYPDGGAGGFPGQVWNPKDSNDWFYWWQHNGSGGGGSSRVWRGEQLLAIAGGGGGAGERSNGGDGGLPGGSSDIQWGGGGGATQEAGGIGGCTSVDFDGTKVCASAGSYLAGASGEVAGSGGGGGYYGGGAGSAVFYAMSGGGGSSWAYTAAFTGDVTYRTGQRSGDGVVTISYFDPAAEPATTLPPTTTTEPPAVMPCRWGGPCNVGDIGPGGGTVFYNATSPWNGANSGPYLEVSTEDVQRMRWCDQGYVNAARATDGTIGGGKVNTDEIVKVCSSGAANKMNDATWGDKTDWYLPNTMELTLMSYFFQRQFAAAQAKDPNDYSWVMWRPFGCAFGYLWSSNQSSVDSGVMYRLDNSGQYPMGKYEQRCAAGVRLFQYGDSSSLPMPTTTTSSTTTEATTTTSLAPSTTEAPATTTVTVAPPTTVRVTTTTVPETTTTVRTNTVPPETQTTVRTNSSATTTLPRNIETVRDNISTPTTPPVVTQRFADWVPDPQIPQTSSTDASGKSNVDSVVDPEVSEFTMADVIRVVGKKPTLEFGIRLPQRAAKSIVHTVTLLGDQVSSGSSCTVSFTNTSKTAAKYSVKVKCQSKTRLVTILAKKKTYAAGSKLRLTIGAAYGAIALEVRSVVKGVTGTPKSGIWRSRWIYAK